MHARLDPLNAHVRQVLQFSPRSPDLDTRSARSLHGITMQHTYSDDRLRLAARLYYVNGLGQAEVAKFVKVSQAKVSRLLALARERGIVRITVADYEPRHRQLEAELRVRLDLSEVVVIKTVEN